MTYILLSSYPLLTLNAMYILQMDRSKGNGVTQNLEERYGWNIHCSVPVDESHVNEEASG